MPKDYKELRPVARLSGITCRECQEEVEWVTFLVQGGWVGVCACSWTSWWIEDEGIVLRSTTNEPGKR